MSLPCDVPGLAAMYTHFVAKSHHAVLVSFDFCQMEFDVSVEVPEEWDSMVLGNASTNPGSMVSPLANSSDVSSQSTRPSLRAMNPSRLATMWIVTRESAFAMVTSRH